MSFITTEKHFPPISESQSLYKKFFKIPILDKNGELLNGEQHKSDGTIIRFVNGYIDGNIYDSHGEVLFTYPAIEHEQGKEYWTKGLPQGFPAISFIFGLYEEYWADGKIVSIKETGKLLKISTDNDDDDDFDEDNDDVEDNINNPFTSAFDNFDFDDDDDFEEEEKDSKKTTFFKPLNYKDQIKKILKYKKKHTIDIEDFSETNYSRYDKKIDKILSYEKSISFQDRLLKIMRIKKLKDTDVYHAVNMSEKAFNKIKNAKPNDSISLNNAIMIAFSLQLTFEQMVKFTNFAGKGFRNYGTRDEIIKKFFDNRNYKLFDLNTELVKFNERPFFEQKDDK